MFLWTTAKQHIEMILSKKPIFNQRNYNLQEVGDSRDSLMREADPLSPNKSTQVKREAEVVILN